MTYQELSSMNATGIDTILVYVSTAIPQFLFISTLALFFIITIVSYYSTRKEGRGDLAASCTVASLVNFFATTLFSIKYGIVNPWTSGTWLLATIGFGIWLYTSRDR